MRYVGFDQPEPRIVPRVIADQWYMRTTFVGGDAVLFDLGSDQVRAEKVFRDTRRQFERATNNHAVQRNVDMGLYRFYASDLLQIELIAPGIEVNGELASEYFALA